MQMISIPPTRASDTDFVSFTERLKVGKDHSISFIDDSNFIAAFLIFKFYFQFYLKLFMSLIVTRSDQLRLQLQGRSQDFLKGGGSHTLSNIIVMAFSPRNIVGCLLKKGLQRRGHGHPRTPPPPSQRP